MGIAYKEFVVAGQTVNSHTTVIFYVDFVKMCKDFAPNFGDKVGFGCCITKVKCGECVGLTTLPTYVSRLSRQCGILNIPQPYRTPQPVTEIALLYADGVCFL
jgi:hypothetical protein